MGHLYIMTNRRNGTLYIGVTGELANRVHLHRIGRGSEFCATWGLTRLVLIESFPTMLEAIAREKAMKRWKRAWKIRLIEEANPNWDDLYLTLNS